MNTLHNTFSAGLLCFALSTLAGCNSEQHASGEHDGHGHTHDHSDTPDSLQAATKELREKWLQIQTAMDNGDPDAAHDPLHEVGSLLEAMPDLAAETDLSESEWNEVKSDVDGLRTAFGDIDSTFHKDGDKVAAYDAAKSTIDQGIAALEAKLPQHGDSSRPDDHDHDNDEDEGHGDHA